MKTVLSLAIAALSLQGAHSSALSTHCCDALRQENALQDKVYYPNTTHYEARIESYWSISAALPPWCMALPTSAEDASVIIKTLAQNNCTFGIRSGGHGDFPLSNSVKEGVTVDFGHMNSTTYDPETNIASLQPGSSWQPVYETLAKYGVTVTGGRSGIVGVGGFILGGGNSFFSASHGFACDTVQNFEIVLANGSIVDANANQNSDLWRALKGGSGNFGLVTRFDMYAITLPDPDMNIWGGVVTYDLNTTDDLIDAYIDFADNVQSDQNSSEIVYWAHLPNITGISAHASLVNTLNTVAPPAFDGLLGIQGITGNTIRSDPLQNITAELGNVAGYRNAWFTSAYKNNAAIMKFAVERHAQLVDQLNATMSANSGYKTVCMFQPITQVMVQHGREKGGNVLGLEQDDRIEQGTGIMFLITFTVTGEENEDVGVPLLEAYQAEVDAFATENGLMWDWRYLNYAYKNQGAIASYGAESVSDIKAVSQKYDASQVFQKLRKSGHHIPS